MTIARSAKREIGFDLLTHVAQTHFNLEQKGLKFWTVQFGLDIFDWTFSTGHFRLDIFNWTFLSGHSRLDIAQTGHFSLDIPVSGQKRNCHSETGHFRR